MNVIGLIIICFLAWSIGHSLDSISNSIDKLRQEMEIQRFNTKSVDATVRIEPRKTPPSENE